MVGQSLGFRIQGLGLGVRGRSEEPLALPALR